MHKIKTEFIRSYLLPVFISILIFLPLLSEAQMNFSNTSSGFLAGSHGDNETKNGDGMKGWKFGISMGMYFAGKETADFYNGSPENENNIKWILNNYYWYEEIKQQLNGHNILKMPDDSTQWWIYYPYGMKYNAAITPGFYAKYNFNNSTGVFIQTNYVKLKTSGYFNMAIDSVTYTSEPALRTGYIIGKEERINIDVGISKFYDVNELIKIFIETGLNINSTQVLESRIKIGAKEYSIINRYGKSYVPNTNMQEYNVYQGGIGFGIFLNGGVKFVVSDNLSFDPGIQLYWKNTKLPRYDDFGMDLIIYLRFIFGNIL